MWAFLGNYIGKGIGDAIVEPEKKQNKYEWLYWVTGILVLAFIAKKYKWI